MNIHEYLRNENITCGITCGLNCQDLFGKRKMASTYTIRKRVVLRPFLKKNADSTVLKDVLQDKGNLLLLYHFTSYLYQPIGVKRPHMTL